MAALLAAALPATAGLGADGFTALVDETVSTTRGTQSDQAGGFVRNDVDEFIQRYRLGLDRSLWPLLRVNAGGVFEQDNAQYGLGSETQPSHTRATNLFASFTAGSQVLSFTGGYARAEQTAGTPTTPFGFVSEDLNLLIGWRPSDLPQISLRLAQPTLRDEQSKLQDTRNRQALLAVTYAPIRQVDLRYSFDYLEALDRVHDTDTSRLNQTLRASWSDTLLRGRSQVSASVTATSQQFKVTQSGPGGKSYLSAAAVAGLSAIDPFPPNPALQTLVPNPALINGDFAASAGVQLGFSAPESGDIAYRELGLQFADSTTQLNTLWVWVDKQLPQAAANTMSFTLWTSADGTTWAPFTGPLSVSFSPFLPRFEISFAPTPARFFKVVVQPLLPTATNDQTYRDLFVVELQGLLVSDVGPAAGSDWTSMSSATLNAGARTVLVQSLNLAHDVALYVTRGERPGSTASDVYTLTNGLSIGRRVSFFALTARVGRMDADEGRGHESEWLWSTAFSATPVPTALASFSYSGKLDNIAGGQTLTNSWSILGQATPIRGVSLLTNVTYGLSSLPTGQDNQFDTLTVGVTLQPHRSLTVSSTFGHSSSVTEGAGLARAAIATNRIDVSATFNPIRTLFFAGSVSRIVSQPAPVTLANGNLAFAPFPGGDLQLGIALSETLDADGSVTRIISPNLRWVIGRATLLATWNFFDNDSPVSGSRSRTLTANLRIPL